MDRQVIKELKSLANPKNVTGMARFGINPKNTLGVSIPVLRKMVKQIGKSHKLAQQLWDSGIHEARILAGMIEEKERVTEKQMDKWTRDFDSWDVCDQVCMNLFDKTPFAFKKALQWAEAKPSFVKASEGKGEFVRRAGFALMACLAWHDKNSGDEKFKKFFVAIKKHSTDERNYVKKAVNWALRQIGKRNRNLNKAAIAVVKEIAKIDSKAAKWIAADALRELTSSAAQKRLKINLSP